MAITLEDIAEGIMIVATTTRSTIKLAIRDLPPEKITQVRTRLDAFRRLLNRRGDELVPALILRLDALIESINEEL